MDALMTYHHEQDSSLRKMAIDGRPWGLAAVQGSGAERATGLVWRAL